MEEYVKKYKAKHMGRVTKMTDYSFYFEELDPKHVGKVVRGYWVMKSYFFE